MLLAVLFAPLGAQQPEDPRRVALDAYQTIPPFVVRVDVDHPDRIYRGGEAIQLSVRSERDGYLYLFYCDASQHVSCLFPNRAQQDNRIAAGQVLIIPAPDSRFKLRVGPPYGREVLKAVVTTKPLQSLEIQALTKGDFTTLVPPQFKGVFVELRDEAAESPMDTSAEAGRRGWSEHNVELTTVAAGEELAAPPGVAELAAASGLSPAASAEHATTETPPTSATAARRVGVFIGISTYLESEIRPLSVADDDARAMAKTLEQVGQLSESVVLVDQQATLANIQRLIQEVLPAATRPGDLIILYWSGHGGRISNVDGNEPDGFDEYLVPYDGRLEPADAIRRTMLLDKTFGRWVQSLDGRKLVVILDACHSGGQSRDARKALAGGAPDVPFRNFFFQTTLNRIKDIGQRETAVLASSRATQLSFEQRDGNLSVMTHFLIERLKSANGKLTLADAASYVMQRVPEFVQRQYPGTTQTPVFVDHTTPPVYLRP